MADLPKPLPASEWQHDMWTADQLRAYAAAKVAEERAKTLPLIQQCCAALAEELAAWDIDPPLAHVKDAHDACETWLADIRGTEAPAHQRAPLYTEATMLARVERARAEERERCARLCEEVNADTGECPELALYCAERIRGTEAASRGET